MKLGNIFKLIARYWEFKQRALALVETAEHVAETIDDDVLRHDVAYLRRLLEKLP